MNMLILIEINDNNHIDNNDNNHTNNESKCRACVAQPSL